MFYSNQTIDSVIGVLIGFEVIHPSIYIFANVCAYQRSKSPTKKKCQKMSGAQHFW